MLLEFDLEWMRATRLTFSTSTTGLHARSDGLWPQVNIKKTESLATASRGVYPRGIRVAIQRRMNRKIDAPEIPLTTTPQKCDKRQLP